MFGCGQGAFLWRRHTVGTSGSPLIQLYSGVTFGDEATFLSVVSEMVYKDIVKVHGVS
jgi:hypothetical protein